MVDPEGARVFFLSFYFVWLNGTVHAIFVLAHRGAAKGSDEPVHKCSFTRAFAALKNLFHAFYYYIKAHVLCMSVMF